MRKWEHFTNNKQWKIYLQNLIKTNPKALLKSIVLIYDYQTEDEKNTFNSVEHNHIGFNKFDAISMSELAQKIKRNIELTPKEIAYAKNVMPKYWRQLMKISKQKTEYRKELEEIYKEMQEADDRVSKEKEEADEIKRLCFEEGKPCSYGICSECPYI